MTTVFRTHELRIVPDTNTKFVGPCIVLADVIMEGINAGRIVVSTPRGPD